MLQLITPEMLQTTFKFIERSLVFILNRFLYWSAA